MMVDEPRKLRREIFIPPLGCGASVNGCVSSRPRARGKMSSASRVVNGYYTTRALPSPRELRTGWWCHLRITSAPNTVIPAKAGIRFAGLCKCERKEWDSRLRGNDGASEGGLIPNDNQYREPAWLDLNPSRKVF